MFTGQSNPSQRTYHDKLHGTGLKKWKWQICQVLVQAKGFLIA
jgi:hypothetical protein